MNKKDREEHNKRVLDKWRRGDNLSTSTLQDTWYPDRSKGFIKKDPEAIKQLYDADPIDDKKLKVIDGGKKDAEV